MLPVFPPSPNLHLLPVLNNEIVCILRYEEEVLRSSETAFDLSEQFDLVPFSYLVDSPLS